jgi:hypothetical protein
MSTEESTEQRDKDGAAQKAQEAEEKFEAAKEKMEEIEKDPPEKLEDWPDDAAKYQTFGGSEDGDSTYDEKHEEALGEHSVRHHDDGKAEVKGEEVDNPDDYKGEPIPGGPTDPDAPAMPGEEKNDDAKASTEDDEAPREE